MYVLPTGQAFWGWPAASAALEASEALAASSAAAAAEPWAAWRALGRKEINYKYAGSSKSA